MNFQGRRLPGLLILLVAMMATLLVGQGVARAAVGDYAGPALVGGAAEGAEEPAREVLAKEPIAWEVRLTGEEEWRADAGGTGPLSGLRVHVDPSLGTVALEGIDQEGSELTPAEGDGWIELASPEVPLSEIALRSSIEGLRWRIALDGEWQPWHGASEEPSPSSSPEEAEYPALTGFEAKIEVAGEALPFEMAPLEPQASQPQSLIAPKVCAQTYQVDVGWRAQVRDGSSTGGEGMGHAVRALRLSVDRTGLGLTGSICYQLATTSNGWSAQASDGRECWAPGSGGAGALKVSLTGDLATHYDVCYQVYVRSVGWLSWTSQGQPCGTSGLGLPIEAVRVCLVAKGDVKPTGGGVGQSWFQAAGLRYWGYVSGQGTRGPVAAGKTLGTIGRALHAFRAELTGTSRPTGDVRYRVSTGSWQAWHTSGDACAVKANAPIYAFQITLTGNMARVYDIWYRVHAQNIGWLGFAKNGASAGTAGIGYWADAIDIRLVTKGGSAPGSTATPYVNGTGLDLSLRNVAGAPGGLAAIGGSYNFNSAAGKRLRSAISTITGRGARLSMVMVDIHSGKGVVYDPGASIYSASSIKGPYVAAVNKFNPGGVDGYVRSVMSDTISWSSNDGYLYLRNRFGPGPMASLQSFVGGCSFSPYVNYSYMTGKDLAKLWVGCYDYFHVRTNGNSAWCRGLFTNPTMSFIHAGIAGRATTYTKPGWINSSSYYLARNDAGIVMRGGSPYVIAILSTAYGRDGDLASLAGALDAVHSEMVA